MIFAVMFGGSAVFGLTVTPFTAVVIGLVLYNGSVLAEIVRAGILSIPRGQAEAALAVGLRRGQVMRMILLPQAVTVMMPAIVAQLVVLLKDTALGFIVSFEDLLNAGARVLPSNFNNIIPAVIVIAIIYIIINMAVGAIATWLERRSRRSRKTPPSRSPGPARRPRRGGRTSTTDRRRQRAVEGGHRIRWPPLPISAIALPGAASPRRSEESPEARDERHTGDTRRVIGQDCGMSPEQVVLPYATWPSPISTSGVARSGLRLGFPTALGDEVWWTEDRPAEGGRTTIVHRSADGTHHELLAAPWSARTRVHEYGGRSYAVVPGEARGVHELRRPAALPAAPRRRAPADHAPSPSSEPGSATRR